VGQAFQEDIENRLARDFSVESLPAVLRSLATITGTGRNRVVRCIVHLSAGDTERLFNFVGEAAKDFRDLIYWAEYDKTDRKVHDFNEPFA
jgi:hypothetical protein